eukprot:scaffold635757_cov18-Prasinocladus_malaysianus.AAC.1
MAPICACANSQSAIDEQCVHNFKKLQTAKAICYRIMPPPASSQDSMAAIAALLRHSRRCF